MQDIDVPAVKLKRNIGIEQKALQRSMSLYCSKYESDPNGPSVYYKASFAYVNSSSNEVLLYIGVSIDMYMILCGSIPDDISLSMV